jgi:hypothetical protein
MRNFTLLTTVLLSSSMLAATAAAQTQSPQCSPHGQRLGLCETIGVSASAAGAASGALDLLRKDYLIVPIEQTAASVFPSHLVIGAADLDDAQIIALLKQSYRVGKTVAIVGATADQAGRFHRLLRQGETANCQLPKGQTISSLYGLQRSRYRFPPQNSSYCLLNLDLKHPAADRRWLRERFTLTPPQPAAGTGTAIRSSTVGHVSATDEPNEFLTDLAAATHCSSKESFTDGTIEMDPYVYTMRNFTDTGCGSCKNEGADYYLVQDNISYEKYSAITAVQIQAGQLLDTTNNVNFPTGSYNLEFTDPATTTTYESQYSNSSSSTVSASVGFDSDGPNVSSGYSVTTSQSTTYDVPPTTILNQSNLSSAEAEWTFTPQSWGNNTDFDVNPTWTWFVPQDSYPSGGTGSGETQFVSSSNLLVNGSSNGNLQQTCNVPFPFSAWTVAPPQLSSLSTTSTPINGGQFRILGQYLYPSSVVAVLIGGNAVPLTTNVDLINDTTIRVTVPGDLGLAAGTYPVQVNTQFNGEDRFSNTLSLTLTN